MTNVVCTKNGQTLMTFSFDYSWSPKGYMLNGYSANMPAMNLNETDTFTYAPVGNYLLPVRIVKEAQLGNMFQPGSTVTYHASNFQLNKLAQDENPNSPQRTEE